MSKRRRCGRRADQHHIIPKSRGGNGNNGNVVDICQHCHAAYHAIFGNRKPNEIIDHLVKTFWNGQKFWIQRYLDKEDSG